MKKISQHSQIYSSEEIVSINISDDRYPRLLREIADPPKVLYMKGRIDDINANPIISIVGTRNISDYGNEVTRYFANELSSAGFTIVSGFMYGVDAVAHNSAINCGGRTIGVLGFGFDHMYPSSHNQLADKMMESGQTLITEYAPWIHPSKITFPARNRIVSGMSLGVLVTEAQARSGSKITARLASEQGREVFAVPGRFDSQFSEGTKELVNLGAKLVTKISDILEEL